MIADETRPEDFINNRRSKYGHIKGWGIDADYRNDPTYPMKNRTDEEQLGYTWERPALQPVETEILKSVERPNITAVFGTTVPPAGLSGMIRRQSFKYSESDMRRWAPLVLADRINVFEGILDDISKGIIPNIPKERGWAAEWKHNRTNFVAKVAVTAAVTTAVVVLLLRQNKKRKMQASYAV